MLGESLCACVINAAEEIRVLAGIPLVREAHTGCVLVAEVLIQSDVERPLAERTRTVRDKVAVGIVSGRADVEIRQRECVDELRADGIDQIAGDRGEIAEPERNRGISRAYISCKIVERNR